MLSAEMRRNHHSPYKSEFPAPNGKKSSKHKGSFSKASSKQSLQRSSRKQPGVSGELFKGIGVKDGTVNKWQLQQSSHTNEQQALQAFQTLTFGAHSSTGNQEYSSTEMLPFDQQHLLTQQ